MTESATKELTLKYQELERDGSPLFMFSAVCPAMGMHFWAQQSDDASRNITGQRYFGGLEVHCRQPPAYREGDEPDNSECWLLDGPCWHDGSSLAAEELWIPKWQSYRDSPELVLVDLAEALKQRVAELEEQADG